MAADGTTFPPFPPFQTIPELDPAVSLNFTDQVWINQAGLDVRCNIGDLAALAPAGVTSFNNRRGAILLNAGDIVLAEGALLNSPAFQGVPQAPTAATGTASDQIATTQFVANAIGAATPGVTSFNNRTGAVSLTGPDIVAAGGVLRNSPAFTGQPIAPTPPPGSNNNTLATTGFVTAAVAAMSPGVTSFNNRTGPIQLTLADVTGVGGAPLVTPIFTGVPQAPNPPRGSDTTQIATCEFVMDAIANSVAGVQSFNGRVGAVTLTTADITAAGGGTVSSVGLAMPTMFTVTGSPVTGSGTLTVTANAQAASTVLAAPVGAGGPPSFRSLTAADIPLLGYLPLSGGAITGNLSVGGSLTAPTPAPGDNSNNVATTQFVDAALAALPPSGGTVTSVAMTVPNIFTITGSPITTSGTLAIGNRAQNANTVFAGPVSGGQAGGTFRALVAADIPNLSGAYLPLTGGTLSGPGNLTVAGVIQTQNQLQITGAAGTNRIIDFMTADVPRWVIAAGVDAESGSNAGSNLYVQSYTDAGAPLVAALVINRATGQSVFGANVTASNVSVSNFAAGYYLNDWQINLDGSDNFNINRSALGAVMVLSASDGTLNARAIGTTGDITSGGSIHANGGVFYANNAAGTFRGLQIDTAGAARWWLLASSEAETGGNAGSNLVFYSYADAGGVIGTPLIINRATGNVSMSGQLAVTGNATFGSALTVNGALTSGAFTGTTVSSNGNVYANSNFQSAGAAGTYRGLYINTTGVGPRWFLGADNSTESGGNAGSNFNIIGYNDADTTSVAYLTINRASGDATFSRNVNALAGNVAAQGLDAQGIYVWGANGTQRSIVGQTGNTQPTAVNRWIIIPGTSTSETGGNSGSDFAIVSVNDAGAYLASPLTITRSNSFAEFSASGDFAGNLACAYAPSSGGGVHNTTYGGYVVVGQFVSGMWYNAERLSVNVSGTTLEVWYNGAANSSGVSAVPSDRRLKSNFKSAAIALDYVKKLKVYELDFNPHIKHSNMEGLTVSETEHWPFSLIADEVAEVMPHAAMKATEADGDHWVGLHPTHLIATLWKAVQELSAKVEALEGA